MTALNLSTFLVLALAASAAPRAVQFRGGVDLVELYVSVADRRGVPESGLARRDFEVWEDGVQQEIAVFGAGRAPLALAVALDRSFSVAGPRLGVMKTAVADLLERLPAEAQVLLLGVGSRVDELAPFGVDRAPQRRALAAVDAFGSTSLHDAIIVAIDRIQAGAGRRALVLLSDGVDRYSRASAAEVTAHARTRDVLVFPLAVGARAPPLFEALAAVTGGRAVSVRDPSRLRSTLEALAGELAAQYVIGYTPSKPATSREWRRIEVRVNRASAIVRTRQGYWTR